MVDAVPETFLRQVLHLLTPWDCGSGLVRLGPDGDGGYLVPAAHLDAIDLVMSAGLGDSAGFEDAMLQRYGVPATIVDGSMDRPAWLAPEHRFHRRWLRRRTGADRWSLADWVATEAPADAELLLQMGIEGAEHPVFAEASPDTLARFRVIVVEFHRLDRLTVPASFTPTAAAIRVLAEQFVPVHIHPNNCCGAVRAGDLVIPRVIEATWVRRSALQPEWSPAIPATLPHPLDRPNVASATDIDLWTGWPEPVR